MEYLLYKWDTVERFHYDTRERVCLENVHYREWNGCEFSP